MSISLTPDKLAAARDLALVLRPGSRVCLTTHVNADGDGIGSEVALAHLLAAQGIHAVITNPTATPARFGFLLRDHPGLDRSADAVKQIRSADVVIVLDIADLGRLGMLADAVRERGVPVACIDHHVSPGTLPAGPRYVDPSAAATGELVCEIATANEWPITTEVARAAYVALLTDTGGFRFSNTRPRTLRIAAELLDRGIDPEGIYLDVYAGAPEGRVRLLAEALATLVVEPDLGLAWLTVPPGAIERYGVSTDDLDGVVEHARSIAGIRMAMLFREIAQGRIKVSLRSVGDVDVATFARRFGGGGHTKAAGLSLPGSLAAVQQTVLQSARAFLHDGAASDPAAPR
jgi:phosphoesterase RecJ-like protein